MNTLVAVAYEKEGRAKEVLATLRKLEAKHLLDLEDAVYATKDREGQVRLHQTEHQIAPGAGQRAVSGTLVGVLVAVPMLAIGPIAGLVGVAAAGGAGIAAGRLGGTPKDTGVNDDFAIKIAKHTPPGGSTLFVLIRRAEPGRVIEEVRRYGGVVLHTTLSRSAERRLREALSAQDGEVGHPGP
jgi:uncharacterized membrane protein